MAPAVEAPPPLHAAVLLLAAGVVGVGLRRARPAVSPRTVLALAPWMVAGASLHVDYQLGLVPGPLAPFLSSPSVYLAAAVLAGTAWLVALRLGLPVPRFLAGAGTLVAAFPVGVAVGYAVVGGQFSPAIPLVSVGAATALAAPLWIGLRRLRPGVAEATGGLGALVIFGHALDAFSTALGLATLGFGERMPVSGFLLRVGGDLFVLPYLGGGWLFLAVKVTLATGIVLLFADAVREDPRQGSLLLGLIAAVGLGPGAHNVLLFAVAAP